jgi:ABC-type glycerol-3-phosphate transport system substrate-binding protein
MSAGNEPWPEMVPRRMGEEWIGIRARLLPIVLILALFLTSCAPTRVPEPVVIHFVSPGIFSLEPYVAQFETDHPGIQVQITYNRLVPDDWPRHFDGALIFGTPTETELWLDLAPLVEADPAFDTEDYYPAAWQAGTIDDRRVALPLELSVGTLLYDPRQWAEAGAEAPTPDWTWDDLLRRAEIIGRYQAQQGRGHVFVSEGDRQKLLLNWLEQQAPLARQDGDRALPALDAPEVEAAVAGLCETLPYLTVAVKASYLDRPAPDYLVMGEAAMTGGAFWAADVERSSLHLAAFPQPAIYPDLGVFSRLAISRGTANPQAAWQWIAFLSRQTLTAGSDLTLPARRSVAAALDVWNRWDPEVAQVGQTLLSGAQEEQRGPDADALTMIRFYLLSAVLTACEGGGSPAAALKTVQQEALEELSARETGPQAPPEPFQVVPLPAPEEAADVLDVLVLYRDDQAILATSQAFQSSHPGVSIRMVPDWSQADCILTEVSRGDGLTLLSMQQGYLPIGDIGEIVPSLSATDFSPQAQQVVSWKGQ